MTTPVTFRRLAFTFVTDDAAMLSAGPGDEGYCYLCLFDPDDHPLVATTCGRYPLWESVLTMRGGFKPSGVFLSRKIGPGIYHIGQTLSAGYKPTHLAIPKTGMVGHQSADDYIPTILWKAVWTLFMTHAFYIKLGVFSLSLIYAFGSTFVVSDFIEPSIDKLKPRKITVPKPPPPPATTTSSVRPFSFSKLKVLLVGLLCTGSVSKLFNFDNVDQWITQNESDGVLPEDFHQVHSNYLECHRVNLRDNRICCDNMNSIVSILDLEMDDNYLREYVELMCELKKAPNWLPEAKQNAIKHLHNRNKPKETIGDMIDSTLERITSETKELASEGFTGGKKVLRGVREVLTSAVRLTRDGGVGTLSQVEDVTRKIGQMTDNSINSLKTSVGTLKDPGMVLGSVIETTNNHVTKLAEGAVQTLEDLSEVIESMTNPGAIVGSKITATSDFLTAVNEELPSGEYLGQETGKAGVIITNRVKTSVEFIDNTTTNLINEIIEQSPRSETVAKRIINVGEWFLNTGERIVETVTDDFGSLYWNAKNGKIKETLRSTLEESTEWSESIGKTIGALPKGVLKGFGVEVEETLLNPTPENVKNYRKALGGRELSSNWSTTWSTGGMTIATIILGATFAGYAQVYFE